MWLIDIYEDKISIVFLNSKIINRKKYYKIYFREDFRKFLKK